MAELESEEDPESPSAMHIDDGAQEASEDVPLDRDEQRRQILDTVAASGGFFKHQQRNEPDLTYDEKRKIAEEILDSNAALFLQRFSRYLYREDVRYFEPLRRTDYEVDFYLRELEKKQKRGLSVQTKNRRYEALQRLRSEGDYFSDKEVRRRNPLLFEQMVGRYMTDKEKEDLDKLDYSTLTFSGLLMHHIDRNELCSRRRQQQDVEEATFEENDSDSDDEECDEPEEPAGVSATEKAMLRSEFMNTMYESFLSGKDHDYDYESVDNNAEYDSLKTRQYDEEEKYFDAEEPEVVDAIT